MKYRVWIGKWPKDPKFHETDYDIETTDRKIRKLLVDLKRKYKGTGVLIAIHKYENGKLYTFLRN
jgi:hypothetical protein